MDQLDIFNVEELIFRNPRAKKVLWDDFQDFFKEYFFLKQSGIDQTMLNKLYIRFLRRLAQKDYVDLLDAIFKGDGPTDLKYNFKKKIHQLDLKLSRKKYTLNRHVCILNKYEESSHSDDSKTNSTGNHQLSLSLSLIAESREKIEGIFKLYPQIFATRTRDEVKITFWR